MSYIGRAGHCTKIRLNTEETPACLAAWLCHLPGQAMAWDDYMVSVVHLRPVEGESPPKLLYPEAEYELMLVALDPDLHPQADDSKTISILTPVNYVRQFDSVGDEGAAELCQLSAYGLADGILPAEPDLAFLKSFWTNSLSETLEHMKAGVHQR